MSFNIYSKKIDKFKDHNVIEYSIQEKATYCNELTLNHKFSDKDHKKTYGKNILIGGTNGFLGSILLSSSAAVKTGSRYFIVCTNKLHAETVSIFQNELVTSEYNKNVLKNLDDYKVVIVGPGLSDDTWSESIFLDLVNVISKNSLSTKLIMDGGIFLFLSRNPFKYQNWVLTPHEGEAAMLLNRSPSWIRNNRIEAACLLQEKYSGVVVLKGLNTIIYDGTDIFTCSHGGHHMGMAGMGDALTGVMSSIMGLTKDNELKNAVLFAVGLHSLSADVIKSKRGPIGVLPSDVIEKMSELVNNFYHES